MKIYRSIELGALELSQALAAEKDLQFVFDPLTDEELFQSGFDIIELSDLQMRQILSQQQGLDWVIQSTQACDAFVKTKDIYKPYRLGAMAFKSFLEFKKVHLDISKSAVLIGNYSFLMSYALELGALGFKKIYLVSPEKQIFAKQLKDIKKILFNVDLQQITFDEMADISELSSLLALDFDLSVQTELVEILTYFNFMAEGALFFDLQQFLNTSLSVEAEKAFLQVLNSIEFHLYKYKMYQKSVNISS